jgi:hypothetical protein
VLHDFSVIEAKEQDRIEPTLAALLTHLARTTVPARLYELLHLGIPFAVECGLRGWWRAAAWGAAVAALGAWGLADRWLWNSRSTDSEWRFRFVRAARTTAGVLAASILIALLVELFLHALGNAPIS